MGSSWMVSDSLDCPWWGLGCLPSRLAGFQHGHFVVPSGWEEQLIPVPSPALCQGHLQWLSCKSHLAPAMLPWKPRGKLQTFVFPRLENGHPEALEMGIQALGIQALGKSRLLPRAQG